MNKLRDLIQAELLGSLAEYEEHGIDDVGLSASIGTCEAVRGCYGVEGSCACAARTYNTGKAVVKWPYILDSSIRLEVFKNHACDDQAFRRCGCGTGASRCHFAKLLRSPLISTNEPS